MIGISEIFLILIVAVFLFKPKDYNLIIKNMIDYYRKIKNYIENFKNQIVDSHINDCAKDLSSLKDEILTIYGKNYIYGDDGKLHQVFSTSEMNDLPRLNRKNLENNIIEEKNDK